MYPQILALRVHGFNKYKLNTEDTIYKIWESIRKDNNFNDLYKLAKLALTLPTSSANVEQVFSVLKLYRTDQRNSLKDETLEGLRLIKEEFKNNKEFNISSQILQNYQTLSTIPISSDPNSPRRKIPEPKHSQDRKQENEESKTIEIEFEKKISA